MRRGRLAAGLALVLLTLAALGPAVHNAFVSIDDPQYLTQNPMVKQGFTREAVRWALTTNYLAQWHPLTWFGHIANWRAFGADPRGHLSVNLFLHIVNVLLVFWLFAEATGRERASFVVAAIFAVHPLQVESVSWACQLKTMLATLWALATLIAYVAYTREPGRWAYARVTLAMALSLCSKMMGVTLPCLMLLLDFWPLKREIKLQRVIEKLPWFALAMVGALVKLTHRAQGHELEMFVQFLPKWCRAAQAAISYATYPAMMVWPVRLALPYPHPGVDVSVGKAVACGAALVLAVALVWRMRVRFPAMVTGALWYAGTLVPVIGLVQVGNQAYADRFMYLPMLGLLTMVCFSLPDPRGWRGWALVALVLIACTARTRDQLGVWTTNEALLRHTLAVTAGNSLAHTNLGNVYLLRHDYSNALEQYKQALALNSMMPETYNNLGLLLVRVGRAAEAIPHFERALELRPFAPDALARLIKAQHAAGQLKAAFARCQAGVAQHPRDAELAALYALSAIQVGEPRIADEQARRALELDADLPRAQVACGYVAQKQGRFADALALFDRAVAKEPENAMAHEGATKALERLGRKEEAAARAVRLAQVAGQDPDVLVYAGSVIANGGRLEDGLALLDRAAARRPRHADTQYRRAVVLERLKRPVEARAALERCIALDPQHPVARRAPAGPLPPPPPAFK